jgi:hypothetical protein
MKHAIITTFFSVLLTLAAGITVSAQTVAGEWDGSFNTPGGARPVRFVFVVDGEKLSGTVKRSSGDVALTGTIKGSDIAFAYTINYGGRDLTLAYAGKVSGDTMSGTVNFGGNAEDSWSAKRVAVAEKPKR